MYIFFKTRQYELNNAIFFHHKIDLFLKLNVDEKKYTYFQIYFFIKIIDFLYVNVSK